MDNSKNSERIDELIDAIMKVARGDFEVQIPISPENSNLDALAIGINMMVDDLMKGREIALENDEIKLLNVQLQEANKKALESDRLKTVFLQNMSHEIRTPLNAIIGFSDLLVKNFNNKEKLKKFSSIIKQRGLDLLDLINDLLDLSRIETNQLPINTEDCNLHELFNDLYLFFTTHSQKLGKTHIKVQYNSTSDHRQNFIHTDKGKIKQIFINLIYNAHKFTEKGKIEFGYSIDDKGKIEYYVSDTGIGIPVEMQTVIFDRFVRLENSSINVQKGTGLGLSIVKGLITLLGGEIKLKSEVGKGSIFYFTVPYDILNSTPIGIIPVQLTKSIDWSKFTVLIVEDDDYNTQYLEEVLSDTQITILTTVNALDAIEMVKSNNKIDLILMDIKLPKLNGLEAARIIKQIKPQIKIIIQSAYATTNEKINAEQIGCEGYICKPINSETLIDKMNECL